MKFVIYKVKNGLILNVQYSKAKSESYIYKEEERMTMLARIDQLLGEEPPGSIGMNKEEKQ